MMKPTILYMPIGSASLPHYFSRAIILPTKYYTNRVDDIQTRFTSAIFFSKTMSVSGTDCFLEIVLTENEMKKLEGFGEGYLLKSALPISRVKNVFFLDESQRDTTVYNINAGAAYLPQRLVKIAPALQKPLLEIAQPSKGMEDPDLISKANRFDILLGGLAFMKVGRKEGADYPKDYFSTLAYFNQLIKDQVLKAQSKNLVSYNDWLTGVFISKKNTPWSEWQSLIYEKVDVNLVEKVASEHKINVEKKLGVIQLDKINPDSFIYALSVLATYGNKTSLSTHELVRLLESQKLSEEKAEEIALIFGLHTRYSNLRKDYQIPVKFTLESQLDYYTIESVYQFVYNGSRESRNFEYLDTWIPRQSLAVDNSVSHFDILDIHIISGKTSQLEDIFHERFGEPLKKLQEQLSAFGENIANVTKEAVRQDYSKQMHILNSENEYLKDQLHKLRTDQKMTDAKVLKDENIKTPTLIPNQILKVHTDDGLDDMELKELKRVAKANGITESKIKLAKPTKKGLEDFIALIRNTTLL